MLLTLPCSDLLVVAPRLFFSFPATYRPFFFPLHYWAHGFGGVMVHECNEYRGNFLPRNVSCPGQKHLLAGWQKSSVLVYAVQLLSVHDLALISNLPTVYLL